MAKELQGKDYERLGLSRGVFSTMSGDTEKMAHSLAENIRKQGLQEQFSVRKNARTGEIGLFNNGKLEGVINKKGFSRQDAANMLRDPTNLLMFVPGLGVASKVAKAPGVAKKLSTFFKQGSKLAGATGATDLANSAVANLEGKQDLIKEGDVSRAAVAGVASPFFEVAGDKILRGIVNKAYPKKTKVQQQDGDVRLTPGQATGNKQSLDYEARASKGEFGSKAQEIIDDYKANQLDNFKDKLSDKNINKIDVPVSFYNPNRNTELASDIQDQGLKARLASKQASDKAYSKVKFDKAGISQSNADELVNELELNLNPEARVDVQDFGKETPFYKSVQLVDLFKKRFANANKGKYANPANTKEMFQGQQGAVNLKLSDGTNARMQYGKYNPEADRGFAGQKIEMKHPNVVTADFENKIKNAQFIRKEANGKSLYLTDNYELIVVGNDGEIVTAYKPTVEDLERKGLQARPSGNRELTELPTDSSPLTSTNIAEQNGEFNINKAFSLPSRQDVYKEIAQSKGLSSTKELTDSVSPEELNRLYNTYTLRSLENSRKVLNKAISDAAKKEDNEALASLMQLKSTFDNKLDELASSGRIEGSAEEVLKLKQARELESEYNRLFENYNNRNQFGQNTLDLGAKELLQLLGTDLNYTPDHFAKTMGHSNIKQQLGIIKRAREIFGNSVDVELQEMFLNNIFTDIANVGREGKLNLKQAIKNFTEKVEKNNAVAKELFTKQQLNQMKEYVELIKKLDTNYDANPSGTSSALAKAGTGAIIKKIPLGIGDIFSAIQEDIVNPAKIRRYLKQNSIKEQRFKQPNKATESIAKLLYAPVITQEEQ